MTTSIIIVWRWLQRHSKRNNRTKCDRVFNLFHILLLFYLACRLLHAHTHSHTHIQTHTYENYLQHLIQFVHMTLWVYRLPFYIYLNPLIFLVVINKFREKNADEREEDETYTQRVIFYFLDDLSTELLLLLFDFWLRNNRICLPGFDRITIWLV